MEKFKYEWLSHPKGCEVFPPPLTPEGGVCRGIPGWSHPHLKLVGAGRQTPTAALIGFALFSVLSNKLHSHKHATILFIQCWSVIVPIWLHSFVKRDYLSCFNCLFLLLWLLSRFNGDTLYGPICPDCLLIFWEWYLFCNGYISLFLVIFGSLKAVYEGKPRLYKGK